MLDEMTYYLSATFLGYKNPQHGFFVSTTFFLLLIKEK